MMRRVFVSVVDWVVRHRPFNRGFGRLAAGLLARFYRARRTLGELLLVDGLILLETQACVRFDLGLRCVHGDQSILPTFELSRQIDAAGEFCLVGAFSQRQKLLHFGLELAFTGLEWP